MAEINRISVAESDILKEISTFAIDQGIAANQSYHVKENTDLQHLKTLDDL